MSADVSICIVSIRCDGRPSNLVAGHECGRSLSGVCVESLNIVVSISWETRKGLCHVAARIHTSAQLRSQGMQDTEELGL